MGWEGWAGSKVEREEDESVLTGRGKRCLQDGIVMIWARVGKDMAGKEGRKGTQGNGKAEPESSHQNTHLYINAHYMYLLPRVYAL